MSLKLKDPALLRMRAYIGGEWVDAAEGGTTDVLNPASGQKLGTVPRMGAADARRAIAAAAEALPTWSRKTAKERGAALRRWNDLMLAHQDDLAALRTTQVG